MRKFILSGLTLSILLFSCQKEIDLTFDPPPTVDEDFIAQENTRLSAVITSQKTNTFLNGQVIDEQSQPLEQVTVSCGGITTMTDNKGFFYFKESLSVNKEYALIKIVKDGYVTGYRTFTPNADKLSYHQEKIMLQKQNPATVIKSAGDTVLIDHVKFSFPANAVVKSDGSSFMGDINVSVRYIDPVSPAFPLMMPGSLVGLNSAGVLNALQSFGMVVVDLRDANGNLLKIAPGLKVKMEMPAPANGPGSVPLWHFNKNYGIWVQQGTVTKNGNVYIAEVSHFSIWNIDLDFSNYKLDLSLQGTNGLTSGNLRADVYRSNNIFVSTLFTDDAGKATLMNCPANEALTLKVVYACDTIIKTIAPLTASRSETVQLNSSRLLNFAFTGILKKCDNQVLANQPFQAFLTGTKEPTILNGITSAQGGFTITTVLPQCQVSDMRIQTTAFYENEFHFSNITPANAGINNYDPVLCDTVVNGQPFDDNEVVNIPDQKLLNVVRQAINKPSGTIYYLDVKDLHYLDASVQSISSLVGMQYFTGLDSINLEVNQLSDISPLQSLTKLYKLSMGYNQISNLVPLQGLTNLVILDLSYNKIDNIEPLKTLTKLNRLVLDWNQLSDVSAVKQLVNLREFYAENNSGIIDYTVFSDLTNLVELNLNYSPYVDDLSIFKKLTNLRTLKLRTNSLQDITPIEALTNLTTLDLSFSGAIQDVTPLQKLDKLVNLHLKEAVISIEPLYDYLPALRYFEIKQTFPGGSLPSEIDFFQIKHPSCIIQ